MHSSTQPNVSDDIDVAALLRAVDRRKYLIAALALATGVLTYFALSFVTPLYSSEARIIIESAENIYRRPAGSQISSSRGGTTDQQAVSSQVQVLQSRDLTLGVVKALKLDEDPEFNKDAGSSKSWRKLFGIKQPRKETSQAQLEEKIVDAFLGKLSVNQLEKSRVIAVAFQSSNPETAAKAANKLADFYLTWQQSERLKQTKDASAWLRGQIENLTKKVENADVAAERFRASSGLLEGSNNTSLDAQQLSELNSQLILAKAQRTEAEARAEIIEKMLKDTGGVADSADVLKSRLIQRLLEQRVTVQRELAEVSATLLPSHPRIKQLKSELGDVRRQIRKEARKVVSGLRNEAQIAGARETSLRESLGELKLSASRGNENHIKLRALEREAKANREVLESYLSRYRDASTRSDQASAPAHASIISRAHVTSTPAFPKKGPITFLSIAVIALLGFAHAVAREIIAPQDAPRPQAPQDNKKRASQKLKPQRSSIKVQTGVSRFSSPRKIAHLFGSNHARLVMSAPMSGWADAAGQSIDVARELAEAGNSTVLVDAMTEGDHVAIALDLPSAPGLHQMLAGEASFEDAVRRDPDSELHVLSGTSEPGRVYGLDTNRLGPMLDALETAYDNVVIYCAPQEASAMVSMSSRTAPALVLIAEPSASDEVSTKLADKIMATTPGALNVAILTSRTSRLWSLMQMQMPFLKRAEAH